ncbi:MAG TPA: DUF4430 domain-containing protein [Solirubrobacteraceae bacterium]|nr:DUF4430 domain-containing protein [Solirubrobacteraceae bacterium]
MRRWAALGAVCAAAVLLAGCGLGPGATPAAVTLTVTRNFGATAIKPRSPLQVKGQETVMSLLMRNYDVHTEYAGGFVQSIDGHAGAPQASPPVAWFYYVNGVEAPKGASATNVVSGDSIWWDLHQWGAAEGTPAVVGSFPEPFRNGIAGKRYPVRVECAPGAQQACQTVATSLQRYAIPAAVAGATGGSQPDTLRIIVGAVRELDYEGTVRSLESGPRVSGVYAWLTATSLTTLDEAGKAVARYGPGSGVIAATVQDGEPPVWIVAGTDAAGTERAAADFNEKALRDHFALAVTPAGSQALPVAG